MAMSAIVGLTAEGEHGLFFGPFLPNSSLNASVSFPRRTLSMSFVVSSTVLLFSPSTELAELAILSRRTTSKKEAESETAPKLNPRLLT